MRTVTILILLALAACGPVKEQPLIIPEADLSRFMPRPELLEKVTVSCGEGRSERPVARIMGPRGYRFPRNLMLVCPEMAGRALAVRCAGKLPAFLYWPHPDLPPDGLDIVCVK